MMRRLFAAALSLPLVLAASARAAEPPTIVYSGATVIDSATGTARAGMVIVTVGERITAVAPAGRVRIPRDAKVVDVRGLYALPGLIQTHVHYAIGTRREGEAHLRRDLYSGITAVRDMVGDARLLGELARAARSGEIAAPDVFYSALFAGPSYFSDDRLPASAGGGEPGKLPWLQAITADTDLKVAIALARGSGATGIKVYTDLEPALVRAIAAEAHRQGIKVWAHAAVFPTSPAEAVNAGVDVVSHSCMLAYQLSPTMPRTYHNRAPIDSEALLVEMPPAMTALFADMKARGTILDATNYVFTFVDRMNAQGERQYPSYWKPGDCAKITRAAYRAGVEVSVGTDAPAAWDAPYPSFHDEIDILAGIGMTSAAIIRSATIVGARVIGREREMGTIESRKLANIVFVSENPLADITALRKVVITVKRGRIYGRSDYVPITEDEMRLPE
jgi:imidazolonepropionase-like amidohydrolase